MAVMPELFHFWLKEIILKLYKVIRFNVVSAFSSQHNGNVNIASIVTEMAAVLTDK